VPPSDTPVPSNTPVPPSDTPVPPANTPVPSNTPLPTNTPVPPPPEDNDGERKLRLSVSDVTQDGLTVTWNKMPIVDVHYYLELRGGGHDEYHFFQGYEERRRLERGMSADTDCAIKVEAYTFADGTLDRDALKVRTAG